MKQLCLFFFTVLTTTAFAQDSTFQRMLDFSRPGSKHVILESLSGTWNFQDTKRSFVKGTLTRKPIYDGRFYIVEIMGGKLQVPIANGKMKEDNYREMQIEGYDNGRMKFVTTSINNHIGSDIKTEWGIYDSSAKSLTYSFQTELIPNAKTDNKRVLKIIDNNHYTEEYYENQNGQDVKVRELDYTRIKEH